MEKINGLIQRLPLDKIRRFFTCKPYNIAFNGTDILLMFIVTFISYTLRIWRMHWPASIVFDEIHFGNFTNFYLNRQYFFDIHPPLPKFLIASVAKLAEYDASIHFGSLYGKPYPHEGYISLRITPIIFSSLVPAAVYLCVRVGGFSSTASFTSAMLVALDTTATTEGRFLLTDGILHFFAALAFVAVRIWFSYPAYSPEWMRMKVIAGLFMGFAISCKYTAASICLLVGVYQVLDLIMEHNFRIDGELYQKICRRGFNIALPMLIFHFSLWIIHCGLLIFVGEDTQETDAKMLRLINLNTTNSTDYSAPVQFPPLSIRALGIVGGIFASNALNFQPHSYMSRPIDWPLLTDVWVGFWSENQMEQTCMGNLFVYYPAFFGFLAVLVSFWKPDYIRTAMYPAMYLLSYLPFFGVPRTMFLYHYIIPLMFGCCCCGVALDLYLPRYWRGFASIFLICFAFYGFIVWAPFVYAYKQEDFSARIWNPAWVHGRPGREKYFAKMQKQYDELEEGGRRKQKD